MPDDTEPTLYLVYLFNDNGVRRLVEKGFADEAAAEKFIKEKFIMGRQPHHLHYYTAPYRPSEWLRVTNHLQLQI